MPSLAPFTPANSVAATVAATSAVVPLPSGSGDQVMVSSLAGNAIAYVAFGVSTLTVVIPTGTPANGIPILPGTVTVFSVPPRATHAGTIGTAGNTVIFTSGDGQ